MLNFFKKLGAKAAVSHPKGYTENAVLDLLRRMDEGQTGLPSLRQKTMGLEHRAITVRHALHRIGELKHAYLTANGERLTGREVGELRTHVSVLEKAREQAEERDRRLLLYWKSVADLLIQGSQRWR